MNLIKKRFIDTFSQAKPGDRFRIAKACGWEMFKGWSNYRSINAIFISFDGKEAIFEDKMNPLKLCVTFRSLKVGEMKIIWDTENVFVKNLPTDLSKNNVIKLWNEGDLKHY